MTQTGRPRGRGGQARQIARQQYYEEYGIGDIDEFSVAVHVFDVVFNSSLTGAAMMLQDAMWETIRGTDLETKFTRDMLPGSTVPKQEWAEPLVHDDPVTPDVALEGLTE